MVYKLLKTISSHLKLYTHDILESLSYLEVWQSPWSGYRSGYTFQNKPKASKSVCATVELLFQKTMWSLYDKDHMRNLSENYDGDPQQFTVL